MCTPAIQRGPSVPQKDQKGISEIVNLSSSPSIKVFKYGVYIKKSSYIVVYGTTFLTTLPVGETYKLTPGTQEAHDYLWSMEGVAIELTHNHGNEKDDFEGYHPGNQEKDGFGHIAVK